MKDMKDQELQVGDTIAYPFVSGSSGYIRIGTIVEFIMTKAPYGDGWVEKMRMEWPKPDGSVMKSMIEYSGRSLKL